MKKTAFIGHRNIFSATLEQQLYDEAQRQIQNGCRLFTMGTHGDFDKLALKVCRQLRIVYPDIEIEVVNTNLNVFRKKEDDYYSPYSDVHLVTYEIETVHYKQQITSSNKQMIDTCDTLICYVDENAYKSGANTTLRYAKKKGLNVINLYNK